MSHTYRLAYMQAVARRYARYARETCGLPWQTGMRAVPGAVLRNAGQRAVHARFGI
jgi:hypothetical protein